MGVLMTCAGSDLDAPVPIAAFRIKRRIMLHASSVAAIIGFGAFP